jgi:hypothetical protein
VSLTGLASCKPGSIFLLSCGLPPFWGVLLAQTLVPLSFLQTGTGFVPVNIRKVIGQ